MVAYSFQARFREPIETRVKPHTLRDPRRGRSRHARPGEELQLYTGMRTSACRIIGRATCDRFQRVMLDFTAPNPVVLVPVTEVSLGTFVAAGDFEPVRALDAFAISDGFEDIEAMARFWRDQHGVSAWQGFLIGWDVTTLVLGQGTTLEAA